MLATEIALAKRTATTCGLQRSQEFLVIAEAGKAVGAIAVVEGDHERDEQHEEERMLPTDIAAAEDDAADPYEADVDREHHRELDPGVGVLGATADQQLADDGVG